MKHLERFKKMLNLSIRLEWLVKNPFDNFQFRFEKNERQYLSKRELQLVETTEFTNSSLQKVKDVFIFSCYTGLSYIDLKELTIHQIIKGIDGSNWIYTKREKTDETVKVPLLSQAQNIMDRYGDSIKDEFLFPVFSNQKVNKYLKEIMGIRTKVINPIIPIIVARKVLTSIAIFFTEITYNGPPVENTPEKNPPKIPNIATNFLPT